MKTSHSLTVRLSLLFAVSAACVLLIAGILFELAFENQFRKHEKEELEGKMEFILDELKGIASPAAKAELPLRLHDATIGHPAIVITIAASDGTLLYSAGRAEAVRPLLESARIGKPQFVTWSSDNHIYRVAINRFLIGMPISRPVNVAIALDITGDQKFVTEFRELLWLGMSLAALSTGWLGLVVVRNGLRPLHDVSAMLANVSAQQLDKPLKMTGVPHELQELVSAFNIMLMRLFDSFRRLSEFSSDIAHELRTPVNNLLLQTQVTLSCERDILEYRANLYSNLEEFERMSRMISDMLFLAKADNRLVVPKREVFDLHVEAANLLNFYEALASEHRVRLALNGTATVCADRLMIQRALSNLLSNAIRFTPAEMEVEVTIGENASQVMIAVANHGQEIPAEDLSKIFDRFYRVDPSRREGSTENVGLGLAITKSMIDMHSGTISAGFRNGRTYFTITLPRQPAA